MIQRTNDAVKILFKGELSTSSIDRREKFYVLRPVQLVSSTPALVSLVTGFGLAKER